MKYLEQTFIELDMRKENGFQHALEGLALACTKKDFMSSTLFDKIRRVFLEKKCISQGNPLTLTMLTDAEELELKERAQNMSKEMTEKQFNTVLLGFEAFTVENGVYHRLSPLTFSDPIKNLNNASTGNLKIIRVCSDSNTATGNLSGGDVVCIFTECVKKDDIKVRFFQLNENNERCWEAFATFSDADVHKQCAILFRTPSYQYQNVIEDVEVFFELFRPSDDNVSDPREFRYLRQRV